MNQTDTVRIGTFTLHSEHVFSESQEFAAWVRTIRVQPGEYALELKRARFGKSYLVVSFPGVVDFSDFSPHFGGNRIGSNVNSDKGKPHTAHIQPYDYILAERIGTHGGDWGSVPGTVTLAEGFRVVSETKYSETFKADRTYWHIETPDGIKVSNHDTKAINALLAREVA